MSSTVAAEPADQGGRLGGTRLAVGYAGVLGFLAVAIAVSLSIGHGRHAAPAVAGFYAASPTACLGKTFKLAQSGEFVDLSGGPSAKLRLQNGHLTGTVDCLAGGSAALDLAVAGKVLRGRSASRRSWRISRLRCPRPARRRSRRPSGRARRRSGV